MIKRKLIIICLLIIPLYLTACSSVTSKNTIGACSIIKIQHRTDLTGFYVVKDNVLG